MKLIPTFIDFETFWSQGHSLTKLNPIDYVMHPDTQIICAAVKVGKAPTDVYFGEDSIRQVFDQMDWSDKYVIGHNMSAFDAMILAWRFGVRPRMWGCTLAMARPIHAKTVGLSLGKLVEHYGLGRKDNTALVNTKGKRLEDFTDDERAAMQEYNRADTEQCAALFGKLAAHFTPKELWHLDCNIRMLVEPQFELDTGLLHTALSVERANRHKSLLDLAQLLGYSWIEDRDSGGDSEADVVGFVREQLASAPKFSALLESRGVEVPMKPSPTSPDKQVPALARTDEAFVALQDHPDPVVAAAARARLEVKSTLTETRIQKFLDVAGVMNGRLPVPLQYCGADTTGRDSGFIMNCQNLPRIGRTPKPSDALRRSMRAPKGYVIGVADQSGIELRINHFLWKVPSSMALFNESPTADLYRAFASEHLFHVPPDQIDMQQRQVAKVAQLGLGYGAGYRTFRRIAKMMGGIDLPESGEGLTCESIVQTWRAAYPEIVQGWAACGEALNYIVQGLHGVAVDPWGLVTTHAEGLRLPSGRLIRYPQLRYVDEGQTWPDGKPKKSWVYADGRNKTYLGPTKTDENCVQALARDSVFEAALRFYKSSGLRPVLRVHDELVYVFPQSEAQDLLAELQRIMRTPPSWWPELVVWSEGGIAETYGDAKK